MWWIVLVIYLCIAVILFGFMYSYWMLNWPLLLWEDREFDKNNTTLYCSLMYSLLWPMFLIPFISHRGWQHGWSLCPKSSWRWKYKTAMRRCRPRCLKLTRRGNRL